MKRYILLAMVLITMVSFGGCSTVEIYDIENYDTTTSTVGITRNLFPCDDFAEVYPYTDSFYRYYDSLDLVWGYETAVACFVYDLSVYQEAKEYCFERFELCKNHQFSCEGYSFAEQLCYAQTNGQVSCFFPEQINAFGYNDETHTLVFLGYYNGKPNDPQKTLMQTDFLQFLKEVYPLLWDNTRHLKNSEN